MWSRPLRRWPLRRQVAHFSSRRYTNAATASGVTNGTNILSGDLTVPLVTDQGLETPAGLMSAVEGQKWRSSFHLESLFTLSAQITTHLIDAWNLIASTKKGWRNLRRIMRLVIHRQLVVDLKDKAAEAGTPTYVEQVYRKILVPVSKLMDEATTWGPLRRALALTCFYVGRFRRPGSLLHSALFVRR